MSTENATPPPLEDFQFDEEPEWKRLDSGARYGRTTATERSQQDTPQRSCLNCGRALDDGLPRGVADRVARVVGDNDGNVDGCLHCARTPYGRIYGSNVVAAMSARRGDATTLASDGGDEA